MADIETTFSSLMDSTRKSFCSAMKPTAPSCFQDQKPNTPYMCRACILMISMSHQNYFLTIVLTLLQELVAVTTAKTKIN